MKLRPLKVRFFDIEANGLLPHQIAPGATSVSRVHCLVVHDLEANWYRSFRNNGKEDNIREGLKLLEEADLIVGHNVISYDIPALALLYGFTVPKERVFDTLVMSRLVYSNLADLDVVTMKRGKLPGRLFKSHSLEAWGYRTGVMKDEYAGDTAIEDPVEREARKWEYWNQAMEDYCVIDVKATRAFFDLLMTQEHYFKGEDEDAIFAVKLEHQMAWCMTKMERNGFPFDERGAGKLYSTLAAKRQELLDRLVKTFGSWWQAKGGTSPFLHPRTGMPLKKYPLVKYPKTGSLFLKDGKKLAKTPYFKGAPYTPIELIQFNPGSRDHIAKVLQENGWVPTEFTETGKPVVDEETLKDVKVNDPKKQAAIDLIAEYMLITKRIGQLGEGNNAWLKLVHSDGLIHGSINPNGAVTGRATHSYPNIAQVPSGTAPYGPECRALFGAKHWRHVWPEAIQVGTDASGLELRCLGHFMARYDNGEYIDVLLNGDIHWKNVLALGLVPKGTQREKDNHEHDAYRSNAKTFIYAFLYGAGDGKIGEIVGGGKEEGKKLKNSFMEATPAIADLREAIESTLVASAQWTPEGQKIKWKRRYLIGLDGRKLHVRSPHSALNTLLQSAGALACKLWVVKMIDILENEEGLKQGNTKSDDFMLCAWVHDEVQLVCKNREIADKVAKASAAAMKYAGEFFKFRCPLETEAKIGDTWLECH